MCLECVLGKSHIKLTQYVAYYSEKYAHHNCLEMKMIDQRIKRSTEVQFWLWLEYMAHYREVGEVIMTTGDKGYGYIMLLIMCGM